MFPDDETSKVVAVDFRDGNVYLTLANGVIVGNPISWFKWLASAPAEKRTNVEFFIAGVFFPDLDEGLDAEEMLKGKSTSAREMPQVTQVETTGD